MNHKLTALEDWIRRFKWALTAIPSPERDDILAEVTGHVLDSVQSGVSPETVLAQFGAPEEYARTFVDQMNASRAQGSHATGAQLRVVVSHANRGVVAAGSTLCLFFLTGVFLLCVCMSLLKLWDPSHVGLWRNGGEFFLGKIDDPAVAADLLGSWFYPLFFSLSVASWWIGRLVLARSVDAIARGQRRLTERKV